MPFGEPEVTPPHPGVSGHPWALLDFLPGLPLGRDLPGGPGWEVVPYTVGHFFTSKGSIWASWKELLFWRHTLLSSTLGCVTFGELFNLPKPQSLYLLSASESSHLGSAIDQLCKAGSIPQLLWASVSSWVK